MPTIALSVTISYSAMEDAGMDIVKEYPPIRVFGTIGFIVAMWTISLSHLETSSWMFIIAGIASLILGFYSFTMPKCPPPRQEYWILCQFNGAGRIQTFQKL